MQSIMPVQLQYCNITFRLCAATKKNLTFATLTPGHKPCLFSGELHTLTQHFVMARFLSLIPLSGTLFQMMSGVSHHSYHSSLV